MKKKILVIDDEKLLCELIDHWLSIEGYEVIMANDGSEGLKKIAESKPDFIFIDILLPGVNGIDLCQNIKKDPKMMNTPIILMSAIYKEFTVKNQIRNSAEGFLEKPFKKDDLLSLLDRFFIIHEDKTLPEYQEEEQIPSQIHNSDKFIQPIKPVKEDIQKNTSEKEVKKLKHSKPDLISNSDTASNSKAKTSNTELLIAKNLKNTNQNKQSDIKDKITSKIDTKTKLGIEALETEIKKHVSSSTKSTSCKSDQLILQELDNLVLSTKKKQP